MCLPLTKKFQSITNKIPPVITLALIVFVWYLICDRQLVSPTMLPSPKATLQVLVKDFPILMRHAKTTLTEAFIGLGIGIGLAFVCAVLMDRFKVLYHALYPILVITQTIPTVALAPILILWLGYEMEPKIALVVLTTFFPIAVSLLDGYRSVDPDEIRLLRSMGANRVQTFLLIKFPAALGSFFSGLKISASYAMVGAVISEWIGGFEGLGVYMTRVRKAYAFDKMFAVILFIIAVSLLLMLLVTVLRTLVMPWERKTKTK